VGGGGGVVCGGSAPHPPKPQNPKPQSPIPNPQQKIINFTTLKKNIFKKIVK